MIEQPIKLIIVDILLFLSPLLLLIKQITNSITLMGKNIKTDSISKFGVQGPVLKYFMQKIIADIAIK